MNKMSNKFRTVCASRPELFCKRSEFGCRVFCQLSTSFAGLKDLKTTIAPCTLQTITSVGVEKIVKQKLMNRADGVGPVCMYFDPVDIGNYQQRRIFESYGVLLKL